MNNKYDTQNILTFLQCLKHRKDLPILPMEVIIEICKYVKLKQCFICKQFISPEKFYNNWGCSRACSKIMRKNVRVD